MPTNFTVVPVEDAERDSNSVAAPGTSKPISLGKIFGEEDDEDNLEGLNSGRNMQQTRYLLWLVGMLREVQFQYPFITAQGHVVAIPAYNGQRLGVKMCKFDRLCVS